MSLSKLVLWCFVLLLAASFSKSQENSLRGDERSNNSTMECNEPFESSVKCRNDEMEFRQRNSSENSVKNYKMQHEFNVNSTKNDRKNNDLMLYKSRTHIIKNHEQSNQMSMKSYANSTELIARDSVLQEINENLTTIADESNSTSNKLYGNSNIDDYNNVVIIVPNKMCDKVTCIQLCCPFGENLSVEGNCIPGHNNHSFPYVYGQNKKLNELFPVTVRDPCVLLEAGRKLLNPSGYLFLGNGSLHDGAGKPISSRLYCLAIIYKQRNIYDVIVCTYQRPYEFQSIPLYTIDVCLAISFPFLLLTFVIYSILPELQNMHGFILRAYVVSLSITYVIMYLDTQIGPEWKYCVPLAYIGTFSLLSIFFWLNIMCFDIWWTLRRLRSSKQNLKQDRKRFVMYSLYAWGIPFILNVIYAIMNYAPGIPKSLIAPEMCKTRIGINEDIVKAIYIYIPMGVPVISNIYFFIATSLTILYLNMHTAHQMTDLKSKYYNENKQRFYTYLKLFILMAILWFTQLVIAIAVPIVPTVIFYPLHILNTSQGIIIFILFVCTKKNKQILLKRLKGNCSLCKIPTNGNTTNTTSTSPISGTLLMRETSSSN